MSKYITAAASVDIAIIRKFSFLTLLVLGLYLLFPSTAHAAWDCTDPNSDMCPTSANFCNVHGSDSRCTGIVTDCTDPANASDSACDNAWETGGSAVNNGNGSSSSAPDIANVAKVICGVAYILVFDVGRGIATLSIIAVGVAAMFGKATWAQAITVAVGIGIICGGIMMSSILTLNIPSIIAKTASAPCLTGLVAAVGIPVAR